MTKYSIYSNLLSSVSLKQYMQGRGEMKTSSEDFKAQVREKWGLPLELGKVCLSELFSFGDEGHHKITMAALAIGILIGGTLEGASETFIHRFEEEILPYYA